MSVLNKQTAQKLNKKKQVENIHENENSDAEKKQWAKGNYASKSEKRKPRYEKTVSENCSSHPLEKRRLSFISKNA